ncbi:hypothetical protein [Streptomyces sp. NPDC088736]|uniref:hypothetical protein n=1 Tax=Streptomyces sp. NPDC088736 TaxID=3365881 RepID=UPI0038046975
MSPLRVLRQIVAPTGRHRGVRQPGQIVAQRIVWCDPCRASTAATVHGAVVRCDAGHIVPGGGQ